MLSALAMVAYLVQPGDTLSGIAASHGVSLAAVESANPQIRNFNIIYQGQSIQVPSGDHTSSLASVQGSAQNAPVQKHNVTPAPVSWSTPTQAPAQSSTVTSSGGSGSGGLDDVPGVPQSFAACVASRESSDLSDPAANGNAYGIIPASGYNVNGASLAHQKQVFAELYAKYGTAPWSPNDGC
jgi:LysM repeat protein